MEDDGDDQQLFKEVFEELQVKNIVRFYSSSKDVMSYLLTTLEKPLLILCAANLPGMPGTELKQLINNNEFLSNKTIPFVLIASATNKKEVEKAYGLKVQGFFEKGYSLAVVRSTLKTIVDYWNLSKNPNSVF